ncbi:DUF5134 domain-containing protein [Streptomyces sp. NPDC015131]|uniref:DUF5134 domain-containing protein n=1 Tax=Streptomyces sp. NPDC015131 TaxID=3364941 RepID=UPI0036FE73E3
MHGSAVSGWLLVALCGAAGVACLLRAAGGTGAERRVAADEAVMGLGMAVMAVPAAAVGPPGWAWAVYAAVFGAAAARALWATRGPRAARSRGAARSPGAGGGGAGHQLHHAVGSLAMVYMAVAMAGTDAHAAHAAGGVPLVTGALLVYYAAYVMRAGARLVPPGPAGSAGREGLVVHEGLVHEGAVVYEGAVVGEGAAGHKGPVAREGAVGPEVALAYRVVMGMAMLAMLGSL